MSVSSKLGGQTPSLSKCLWPVMERRWAGPEGERVGERQRDMLERWRDTEGETETQQRDKGSHILRVGLRDTGKKRDREVKRGERERERETWPGRLLPSAP